MLAQYYRLVKPGIVYGNVLTTVAAFLYASRWHIPLPLFIGTLSGIAFVIASACVFNNWLDIDIDRKMERTRNRALAAGIIPVRHAIIFAAILGLLGLLLLSTFANLLTAGIALSGSLIYIILYGYAKRRSHWGTVVGSSAGAMPIVVGYTAVMNRLDAAAFILFLTLVFWQMPHFYAIAFYRVHDYQAAGIPTLPARKTARVSKIYILSYIIAYLAAASSLAVFSYAGYLYLIPILLTGLIWLCLGVRGFAVSDDTRWARKLFLASLVALVSLCVALPIGALGK